MEQKNVSVYNVDLTILTMTKGCQKCDFNTRVEQMLKMPIAS